MKKLILMTIIVALMAVPAFAGATFSFTNSTQLTGFSLLTGTMFDSTAYQVDGGNTAASLDGTFTSLPGYGVASMGGDVGFVVSGVGLFGSMEYVSLGDTFDLTGFDSVTMKIYNDNNQDWQYKIFADNSGDTAISAGWTTISAGTSTTLTISGFTSNGTDTVGFLIGSDLKEDISHSSVTVPAPGAMILGSIGVSFVGWLRRRRSL